MNMLRKLLAKLNHKFNAPQPIDRAAVDAIGAFNEFNREQWIEKKLKGIPAGLVLLDAGAGEQPYKKHCAHLNYVSQDFAGYNPEALKEGLQMKDWDYGTLDIVSDVTAIPRPDESFDVVLCTEVIEHIVNPIEAIKEFSRLLKPGGQLLLTAPFCSMTHFAPYHFYSGYNRFFYEWVLQKYGFEIIEMEENGNYFEYVAQELKRLESMGMKYSKVNQPQKVKQAMDVVLDYIQQCVAKDQGSKELLFFGMHVKAVKKEVHNL
ncbi:MAG: methylase involved in ubiquinone/menaquinone biosynthesis [Cytophagaceae bacterium]|jgi:ubiquinone/menaquinone biosynthesis C-methylase UbiE|nr:methylase involved in ubiquinone/menaquinone biosynthesis [Cytophagaceae bacterium]